MLEARAAACATAARAATLIACIAQGWDLEDALREVKARRPQAHPYLDCWHTMRARLTEGRTQEILHIASRIYEERKCGVRT
jgi:hypothetical protein